MKRVERVLDAKILLVTDTYINFYKTGLRFARYERCSLFKIFERAIKEDLLMEMLLERIYRDKKFRDYVLEAKIVE